MRTFKVLALCLPLLTAVYAVGQSGDYQQQSSQDQARSYDQDPTADNPNANSQNNTQQGVQRPQGMGYTMQRQDMDRPNEIRSRTLPDLQSEQDRLNDRLNQNNGLNPTLMQRPIELPTEFQRAIHLLIG